jgi:hypothetical protein
MDQMDRRNTYSIVHAGLIGWRILFQKICEGGPHKSTVQIEIVPNFVKGNLFHKTQKNGAQYERHFLHL